MARPRKTRARVSKARLARARNRRRSRRIGRKKSAPRWRRRVAVVLLALVSVALGAGATAFFGFRWFQHRPAPGDGSGVAVSWPDGLDAGEAAALMLDLGLTDNEAAMALYLRATNTSCFKPGPHLLPTGLTPGGLVSMLCRAKERETVKVTIPEGFHRYAIARRLDDHGVAARGAFLHASADAELLYRLGIEPPSLAAAATAEGFLFPATYELFVDSDPVAVVTRLTRESERRFRKLVEANAGGWERLQADLDFDRRKLITLASMVEKETGVASERPIIASVFLNRLRDPAFKHLQSDPTSMYGCRAMPDRIAACKGFDGQASRALNRDADNVYSTYVSEGLPPGPIANPGAASVEAVLAPADTSYLYFVAKGGGEHAFSASYDEHLAAVRRLRELRTP
jgi:UPF0755 protein